MCTRVIHSTVWLGGFGVLCVASKLQRLGWVAARQPDAAHPAAHAGANPARPPSRHTHPPYLQPVALCTATHRPHHNACTSRTTPPAPPAPPTPPAHLCVQRLHELLPAALTKQLTLGAVGAVEAMGAVGGCLDRKKGWALHEAGTGPEPVTPSSHHAPHNRAEGATPGPRPPPRPPPTGLLLTTSFVNKSLYPVPYT